MPHTDSSDITFLLKQWFCCCLTSDVGSSFLFSHLQTDSTCLFYNSKISLYSLVFLGHTSSREGWCHTIPVGLSFTKPRKNKITLSHTFLLCARVQLASSAQFLISLQGHNFHRGDLMRTVTVWYSDEPRAELLINELAAKTVKCYPPLVWPHSKGSL